MTTAIRDSDDRAGARAWKGTVMMVGLLALLLLLNGCYTVLAEGGARYSSLDAYRDAGVSGETGGADYYADEYYADEYYGEDAYAEEATTGLFSEQAGTVGVRTADYSTGDAGLGVRYRMDYSADSGPYRDYVHDGPFTSYAPYRRSWARRMHVDWYLHQAYGSWPWPHRRYSGWSVGIGWGGFYFAYGSWQPYWHDPFYWDVWWAEPYWPRYPMRVYTYDPWYDSVVYVSWRTPYWDPWWNPWCRPHWWDWYDNHYAWYRPWYRDSGWYGPYVPRSVVVTDYERRGADRRRGLTAIRDSRGAGTGAGAQGTDDYGRRGAGIRDARGIRGGTYTDTGDTRRGGRSIRDARGAGTGTGAGRGTGSTGTTRSTGGSTVRDARGTRGGSTGGSGGGSAGSNVRVRRPPPDGSRTVRIPDTDPVTRPTTRPTTRPVTRPTTRPVTRPTTRPTTRPVTRPTTRPATRPTTRPTTRPPSRVTTSRSKPPSRVTTSRSKPPSRVTTSRTKPPTRRKPPEGE